MSKFSFNDGNLRIFSETSEKEFIRILRHLKHGNIYSIDMSIRDSIRLPNELTLLTNLRKLTIDKIGYKLFQGIDTCPFNFPRLTHLELKNLWLLELPRDFEKLINLRELNISGNELVDISEVCNLRELQILNVEKNNVDFLPPEFGNLTNLTQLSLHGNSLVSLPDEFCNLTNLVSLDLITNYLKELPETFGNLIKLKELDLTENQLISLPKSIENLSNLRNLDISGNYIQTLNFDITKMINLKYPDRILEDLEDMISSDDIPEEFEPKRERKKENFEEPDEIELNFNISGVEIYYTKSSALNMPRFSTKYQERLPGQPLVISDIPGIRIVYNGEDLPKLEFTNVIFNFGISYPTNFTQESEIPGIGHIPGINHRPQPRKYCYKIIDLNSMYDEFDAKYDVYDLTLEEFKEKVENPENGHLQLKAAFYSAIECGKLDILTYIYETKNIDIFWRHFRVACNSRNDNCIEIIDWLLDFYEPNDEDFEFLLASCNFDVIESLLDQEFEFDTRLKPRGIKDPKELIKRYITKKNKNIIYDTILRGDAKALEWLLDNNFTLDGNHDFSNIPNRKIIMKILHQHGLCDNNCEVCLSDDLWNLWELDSEEYDNYIQLLPREIVEDLEQLLV